MWLNYSISVNALSPCQLHGKDDTECRFFLKSAISRLSVVVGRVLTSPTVSNPPPYLQTPFILYL